MMTAIGTPIPIPIFEEVLKLLGEYVDSGADVAFAADEAFVGDDVLDEYEVVVDNVGISGIVGMAVG